MKKYIIIIILILIVFIFKKNKKKKEKFIESDQYSNISVLKNRLRNLNIYNDGSISLMNLKIKYDELNDVSNNFKNNYTERHKAFIKELNDKKKLLYVEIVPKLLLNTNILDKIIKAKLFDNKAAETTLNTEFEEYKTAYNKTFDCKVEKFTSKENSNSKLSEIEYIKTFIENDLDNNKFYKMKDDFKVIDLINKEVDIADEEMKNLTTTSNFDCKTLKANLKVGKFNYYNQFKCLSEAFETYYDKTLKLKEEIRKFITSGLKLVHVKAKPVAISVGIVRNTQGHNERAVHGVTLRSNRPRLINSDARPIAQVRAQPVRLAQPIAQVRETPKLKLAKPVAKFTNTEKFSNEAENISLNNLDLLSKELTKNNIIYIPKLKVNTTNIISDSKNSKIKNINSNINRLNSVLGTYSVSADNKKPRTIIAKKSITDKIVKGLEDLVDEIGEYIHCNYDAIKKAKKMQGATVKALEDHLTQLAEYNQAQNQYNSQMYYGNYR